MYLVRKQIGETPLECINRLFNTEKDKFTYAGRLDPMAEGLLIILKNKEIIEKEKYNKLNKTYIYSFIIGIQTDTFDALGKIINTKFPKEDQKKKIKKAIQKLKGIKTLQYPTYSSKTVNGIPLFKYARENKLKTIEIPKRKMEIYKHALKETSEIELEDIRKKIINNIKKVNGDFRQEEIISDWENIKNINIQLCTVKIHCSSGTYVRKMVDEIGKIIKYPTATISINRIRIGKYTDNNYNKN